MSDGATGEARTRLEARAVGEFARHVGANPYPGRGLVIGRAPDGSWLQVYWIMGRSAGSRNRIFVADGPELRTIPADADAGTGDASLTLYEAMLEVDGVHIVTNGDQTRTIAEHLEKGEGFEAALATREREHDAPNYTPRISAMLDLRAGAPELALSILKANPADPAQTDRTTFRPANPPAGLGLCLTTYEGDGDPLPSFQGDPRFLPLEGDASQVIDRYWQALDADNRVALAVKRIPLGGGPVTIELRNRHA